MITTITLNPSFDLTLEVDALLVGGVTRSGIERLEAAGKGVNVSRALAAHGIATRALAAVDPSAAHRYQELLDIDGILEIIPAQGVLRTNVSIVEPAGVVTKINGPGPTHTDETRSSIHAAIDASMATSSWIVLSGSLPPGLPEDTYARIVSHARGVRCRVALDAEGVALAQGVEAGPDLVKPNLAELQELQGGPIATLGDAIGAARSLLGRGARAVLCSLGSDGALLVRPDGHLYASTLVLDVDSDVGAGDAMLAGFLAGDDADEIRLARAVAWGTAACRLPGSRMPGPADVRMDDVEVTDGPDLSRRLTRAGEDRARPSEGIA